MLIDLIAGAFIFIANALVCLLVLAVVFFFLAMVFAYTYEFFHRLPKWIASIYYHGYRKSASKMYRDCLRPFHNIYCEWWRLFTGRLHPEWGNTHPYMGMTKEEFLKFKDEQAAKIAIELTKEEGK